MTHYVIVVERNKNISLEDQMAPFEEKDVERYVSYTKEQLIKKTKQDILEYKNRNYTEYLNDPKKYIESCSNEGHIKFISEEFPKRLKWNDKEIYQFAIKYEEEENIGPEGEIYSTYNPNSKWDWFEIGGRWADTLKLKNGCFADSALKKDIDFSMDQEQYKKSLRNWDLKFGLIEAETKEDEDFLRFSWYNNKYYKLRYKTKEEYAESQASRTQFTTYLDKEGNWHEAEKAGMFGTTSASPDEEYEFAKNFYKNFIEKLDDNTELVIVDCHI